MRQFEITRGLFDAEITAWVLELNGEVQVTLCGGTRPHIGAVSISSPTGSVETTQFPGHKEGVVCARWAKALSKEGYRPCVVVAGIHYDHLDRQGIDRVVSLTEEMRETMLRILSET